MIRSCLKKMSEIVVSIALSEHRLSNVQSIVEAFKNGKIQPKKIYFFVSRIPYFCDNGLKQEQLPTFKNVEFIFTKNIGPQRRHIPILKMYWNKPNTKIVIHDDDRLPSKYTVSDLVKMSNKYPNTVFTHGGYKIFPYEPHISSSLKKPKEMDVLVPCIGTLIKPKFFFKEDVWNWRKYEDDIIDITLSNEVYTTYCVKRKGIGVYMVSTKKTSTQIEEGGKGITGHSFHKYTKKSKLAQQRKWKKTLKKSIELK